jgi:glycosyltransferase involved in cell wall biosynthesis
MVMKKRILIHTLIFSPDGVSTAYLYNDIALKLKEMGYDVVVLTTTPHFNIVPEQVAEQPMRWKVWGVCKVSDFHGIKVLHVPQKKFKSTALRLLGFLYWHIVSFFLGLTIKHVDLILSPSPPLTIGYLNLMLARLKGCKVVYNVQEIYPDILQLKDGFVLKALKGLESRVYNGSDAVTTIDQVFYDTIVGRFEDKTKLHIIPNFVDTELYRELSGLEVNSLLDTGMFPETESIKLLYAGNIGHAQSWEPLIELAERTREMAVEYFVIGEGARRDYVASEIERLKLEKVHLLEYQPRELMPAILSYSDASFIFMDPASDGNGFPSKVYTIMACERPMLILSGENTPIVNFLKGKGCAKLITNKNFDEKVEEMVDWLANTDREKLREMGRKGLEVIEKGYTKERVTRMYGEIIQGLVG